MITEVILPVLDQTGGEFIVARWLKREGDTVRAGDILCEVETGKANVEIEAKASGVLRQVLIHEGQAVPALTVLALIGDPSDPLPNIDPFYRVTPGTRDRGQGRGNGEPEIENRGQEVGQQDLLDPAPHVSRLMPHASPRARKLASQYGIDLSTVVGSGPDGRIIEDDVLRVIEAGG
jgi:pyruvate dehydrogenase E2 component (dihydrolipoamide acetyltransferase)